MFQSNEALKCDHLQKYVPFGRWEASEDVSLAEAKWLFVGMMLVGYPRIPFVDDHVR
jgi:hypothetical protein